MLLLLLLDDEHQSTYEYVLVREKHYYAINADKKKRIFEFDKFHFALLFYPRREFHSKIIIIISTSHDILLKNVCSTLPLHIIIIIFIVNSPQ
jgi:hypothetical protein